MRSHSSTGFFILYHSQIGENTPRVVNLLQEQYIIGMVLTFGSHLCFPQPLLIFTSFSSPSFPVTLPPTPSLLLIAASFSSPLSEFNGFLPKQLHAGKHHHSMLCFCLVSPSTFLATLPRPWRQTPATALQKRTGTPCVALPGAGQGHQGQESRARPFPLPS